jgi:glycerophosphoryl diester phosphodiesterase
MEGLISQGVLGMEVDVGTTLDGKLILHHDRSLDREAGIGKRVESMTLQEIHSIELRNGGSIPSLDEVFKWMQEHETALIQLDIKRGTEYEDVIDKIHEYGMKKRAVVIVYAVDQAEAFHRLDHQIVISVPVRNMNEWNRLQNSTVNLDRVMAFTGTNRSPKSLYDLLHEQNIATIFGTLGNIDRQAQSSGDRIYEDILNDGADILSTDRPVYVNQLIHKLSKN